MMKMAKSKQLSKWEKEVRRLSITSFKETDSALFNHYKKALKEMKVELKEYIDAYDELSFSKRLEAERQIQIANKIDNILIDLNKWSESDIRKSIEKQANFGYYGTWYALEGAENIQVNFSMLPEKYIKELVNKPVDGKRFSKRLYNNRKALAEQVTTSLLNGVTRGHGYAKIAKQIGELTEADYKKSLRIARTEGGRVRSITRQQSYEEAKKKGVDIQKQWVATLDKKTRHQHTSLDGQTVEIEEQFEFEGHKADGPRLFGVAALDINCRCTTITIVNGVSPEVRRDNESKEVIDYKNYNEWAEDKGIKVISENTGYRSADIVERMAEKGIWQNIERRNESMLKDKIALEKKIEEAKQSSQSNLDAIKKERRAVMDDLEEKYNFGEISLEEYNRELKKAREKYDSLMREAIRPKTVSQDEINKWIKKHNASIEKRRIQTANEIKEFLSEYRTMGFQDLDIKGHLTNPRAYASKTIQEAYEYLPNDWINDSINHGTLTSKRVKRGYYRHSSGDGSELALSGEGFNRLSTAIHELIHRAEYTVDGILDAEKAFYALRTKGEKPVKLKDILPGNYRNDEITRLDDFLSPYMGKDYDENAYELLTMGVQMLYTEPEKLRKDKEMLEWVIDMLVNK